MKDHALSLPAIFLLLLLPSLTARAQTSVPQPQAAPSHHELGVFGVLPLANGHLKGTTSDRQFFLFGLSYSYLLTHRRVCDVRWVSEIMPVELLAEPFIKGTNFQTQASVPPFTETKVSFGLGTNPVGADVIFLPEKRWQPFTGVHAGASYFTRNVLDFRGGAIQLHARWTRGIAPSAARRQVSLGGLYVPAHVKRLHGAGEPRRGFPYGVCSVCISV